MNNSNENRFTTTGTNIEEVKRKNAESGLSYNEVKAMLANSGGQGIARSSDENSGDDKGEYPFQKNEM